MLTVVEDFANTDEVNVLMNHCRNGDWGQRMKEDIWAGRSIRLIGNHDSRVDRLSKLLLKRVQSTIKSTYNHEQLYADCFHLVRWDIGDFQLPHADAENPHGASHPYPWREYGCILYLHNDFQGGEIFFPTHNLTLKPAGGTLVFFSGTLDDLHGVKKIESGVRYNLASFWTTDKDKGVYD